MEGLINVYKFQGYRPTIRSKTWMKENEAIITKQFYGSIEYGRMLFAKNEEIMLSKAEPYYSELIYALELNKVKNFDVLRNVAFELWKGAETHSLTREQIDAISKEYDIEAWENFYWLGRLVQYK